MFDPTLISILRDEWGFHDLSAPIIGLGNAGGFSGARLWRWQTAEGDWCLRRWPAGSSRDRLRWIHQVVARASETVDCLAVPLSRRCGDRVYEHCGHLWEVSRWLPGQADFEQRPSFRRLTAAMARLAAFHQSVANDGGSADSFGFSPGLMERRKRLHGWLQVDWNRWESACRTGAQQVPLPEQWWTTILEAARSLVPLAADAISEAPSASLPMQPCLRDIWHDHVLFIGDQVTGIVDYDAIQVESVAGDIARLLGSMVGEDEQAWQVGLEAYQQQRPLSSAERLGITAFDWGNVVLSGLQWLAWLYADGRRFDDWQAVERRVRHCAERLASRKRLGKSPLEVHG